MKAAHLLLVLCLAALPAAASPLAAGWQALANYRAAEALKIFDRSVAAPEQPLAREARFGRGVALLDIQPVTGAQLDEARRIFTELADSGADDPAQGARFFLGRIAQHHQPQPDADEAARQYRRLISEHGDSRWAQSALSRLALLQIYELNPQTSPATRIAEAGKLLAHARLPSAESELHYAIANAIFFHRLPAAGALPHLLAAERLGQLDWPTRVEVLVQIAELSRLAGENAQAAKFYRTFLAENPRDLRVYVIREHLAAVEKNGAVR
jgi:hypothetical protein